jgi:hypothetical protein
MHLTHKRVRRRLPETRPLSRNGTDQHPTVAITDDDAPSKPGQFVGIIQEITDKWAPGWRAKNVPELQEAELLRIWRLLSLEERKRLSLVIASIGVAAG